MLAAWNLSTSPSRNRRAGPYYGQTRNLPPAPAGPAGESRTHGRARAAAATGRLASRFSNLACKHNLARMILKTPGIVLSSFECLIDLDMIDGGNDSILLMIMACF